MKVFARENLVVKSWCNNPEEGALDQAFLCAQAPYIFRQICLMPDTHLGYSVPIGGVIATKGVILPQAVGVDIGCGMIAVQTTINAYDHENLSNIIDEIKNVIPVGTGKHREVQCAVEDMPSIKGLVGMKYSVVEQEFESARYQLGSLGSGNHFLEIQKDNEGYLWIMIHSGSRNLGYKVAEYYIDIAEKLNKKWHVNTPKDLWMLPLDSDEGQAYMLEMQYCVDFAFYNRMKMLHYVMGVFIDTMDANFGGITNIAHNYAALEHHYGENVIVHRKGATRARLGEKGIIPGSQGTKSYIVEGLGNKESFESCSHGAGRTMGRKEAQKNLNLAAEIKKLDDQGIIHSIKTEKDLDEAAGAYKPIDIVMEEQKDLVKILTELTPVAVIKG